MSHVISKTIQVHAQVAIAGDSIWYDGSEAHSSVHVDSVTVVVVTHGDGDKYAKVKVAHGAVWDLVYTDTGFDKSISEIIGFKCGGSEQGMQADGAADMDVKTLKEDDGSTPQLDAAIGMVEAA